MSKLTENEDMPAPDDAYAPSPSTSYMICSPCRDQGLRGHRSMTDDGCWWVCPDCEDRIPTVRQIIADTRVAIVEGRKRRIEQMHELESEAS